MISEHWTGKYAEVIVHTVRATEWNHESQSE
jgi:hypothetical protein